MGYFAEIDNNNIVQQVVNISNDVLNEPELSFPETEVLGRAFISQNLRLPGVWKQTSYNGSIRKNYAGIGFFYDAEKDAFIPPKPYESWTLNENTCLWEPPTPIPEGPHTWDEESQSWILTE